MKTNIFPVLLLVCMATSCKKEEEAAPLNGDWQLVAQFNGYANGGDFQWTPTPSAFSKSIGFLPDGRYTEAYGSTSCTGQYFRNSNQLQLQSGCLGNYAVRLHQLSARVLEIAYPVREGEILERYERR